LSIRRIVSFGGHKRMPFEGDKREKDGVKWVGGVCGVEA
jgi:hypothetical protein